MSRFLQLLLASLCLQLGTGLSAGEPASQGLPRPELGGTANPRLLLVNWENRVLASSRNSTLSGLVSATPGRALLPREKPAGSFDGMGSRAGDALEQATLAGSLLSKGDGYVRIRSQEATAGTPANAVVAGAASGWFAGTRSHPGANESDLRPGLDTGIPTPLVWMLGLGALLCLWLIGRELLS